MYLKQLHLTNFRNYGDYIFKPAGLTILVGPNGSGKTNLIESVRILTLLKSFRAKRQTEVIKWGQEFLRLTAETSLKKKSFQLEIYQDSRQKQIKFNQVKKPIFRALGFFKSTLFTPDDLMMVSGAPALRRKWMDMLLAQKNRRYLKNLVKYHQTVRNRNQVLSRIAAHISGNDELDYWDGQMLETGKFLQGERSKLFDFFNSKAADFYQRISGKSQSLLLKPRIKSFNFRALKQRLVIDIKVGNSTLGPHLDDFYFELAGRNIASFGSRGEYRSVILALKILESEFLTEDNGRNKPIILLDDIMSELDSGRRQHLFDLFDSQQVILTTTDIEMVEKKVRKGAKVINLTSS